MCPVACFRKLNNKKNKHLFLNIAMFTDPSTAYGCFHATMVELGSCDRVWSLKLNALTT